LNESGEPLSAREAIRVPEPPIRTVGNRNRKNPQYNPIFAQLRRLRLVRFRLVGEEYRPGRVARRGITPPANTR